MEDHIQIGDIAPRVAYIADGATSTFIYLFPVFEDADLGVYVDGVFQTLDIDYSVSGAGLSAGGSVTFVVAPADGALVTILRNLVIKRILDFQSSGEFRASVINDELDFLIAALQQVDDKISRTVQLDASDTAAALTLLDANERAGRLLSFDENGDLSLLTPNDNTYITLSSLGETLLAAADVESARIILGAQAELQVPSQVEAEAGTATTARAWTAERMRQSIYAFRSEADVLARDMAASALAYVMAQNDATSIVGSLGRLYLSDDFETDSLSTKTNAIYDASGDYYHNPTTFTANINPLLSGYSGAGLTVESNKQSSGWEPWRAFDDNYNTWWDTFYAGTPYDDGILTLTYSAAKTIAGISMGKRTTDGQAYLPADFTFEGYNGTNWDVLLAVSGLDSSDFIGDQQTHFALAATGSYAQYRLNVTSTTGVSNNEIKISKFECYEAVALLNMTLAPAPVSLDITDPTDILAYVVIAPQENITVGTEITMIMSIDGGTTNATGAWTKVGDIGSGGKQLWRVEADVSAQSGTSLTYEIATANNKEIRLHDCVGLIAIY